MSFSFENKGISIIFCLFLDKNIRISKIIVQHLCIYVLGLKISDKKSPRLSKVKYESIQFLEQRIFAFFSRTAFWKPKFRVRRVWYWYRTTPWVVPRGWNAHTTFYERPALRDPSALLPATFNRGGAPRSDRRSDLPTVEAIPLPYKTLYPVNALRPVDASTELGRRAADSHSKLLFYHWSPCFDVRQIKPWKQKQKKP